MDEAIPSAVDFVEWIENSIGRAGVMIVVIGPSWVDTSRGDGTRRIDEDRDFVRGEIAAALDRGIDLLPVLVGGAKMPSEDELPSSIGRLAHINAVELRDGAYWKVDVDAVVERAAELLPHGDQRAHARPNGHPRAVGRGVFWATLIGLSIFALGIILLNHVFFAPDYKDENPFADVSTGLFKGIAPAVVIVSAFLATGRAYRGRRSPSLEMGLLAGLGLCIIAMGAGLVVGAEIGAIPGGVAWVTSGIILLCSGVVGGWRLRDRSTA